MTAGFGGSIAASSSAGGSGVSAAACTSVGGFFVESRRAGIPAAWIEWRDDTAYHTRRDTASRLARKQVGTAGATVLDPEVVAQLPQLQLEIDPPHAELRVDGEMIAGTGSPRSLTLKAAWTLMHTLDKSLFPQAAIIPLLDKHRIITQVAGHNIDVVKLLPPLVISESDVRWFLKSFEEVMVQMHKFPGPAWDVISDIGKMVVTNRAR